MLERLIELYRRRGLDKRKAREHIAKQATLSFHSTMAGYDAFVPYMARVKEPALLIGTAKDSLGTEIPVRLALEELFCHWLVQGGSGTGKTSFVTSIVARALCQGCPIGIVDCKSGFFDAALQWIGAIAYSLDQPSRQAFLRRLAIVNPFSDALVPLNICCPLPGSSAEVQAYEVSLTLSRLFDNAMGFQMENILRHLLLLLMDARLSLVEAPCVLQDELLRGVLVERSENHAVKDFFLRTYPVVPAISKDALLARLQSLLLPQNLRLALGADDLIDIKGILDRGDSLIAFLGKGPGVPEEQVELLGSLFLQLLFQAAFAGGERRRPYLVVLDEFFHLLEAPALGRRFETALTTLRSFGVLLALVMHNFSQIPPTLRETILGNCDAMALFRTSSRNAQFFGEFLPELDPEAVAQGLRRSGRVPGKQEIHAHLIERLQRLPNRHCYWYDRRRPYRAVLLRAPDLPQPHESIRISARALEEFIDASDLRLGSVALPKSVLSRQIEARQERLRQLVQPPIQIVSTAGIDPSPQAPSQAQREKSRKPRLG